MKQLQTVAVTVLILASAVVALRWEDDDYGGQVKWAFNCDFDSGEEDNQDEESNDINIDGGEDMVRLIGQHPSSRDDCGWLCWADVRCHYFSHSQSICRIMTTTKKRLIKSLSEDQQQAVIVPFLADSDTICGYIPSRTGSFPINSTTSPPSSN